MKNMKKKKFYLFIGIGLLALVLMGLGLSYALWVFTKSQTGTNVVETDCFELTLVGSNDIRISPAFPIRDSEVDDLTPYSFTITNICNHNAAYEVNLETLSKTNINLDYINVRLNNGSNQVLSSIASNTYTLITDALNGKKLDEGVLLPNESKSYTLRIWLDEDAPQAQVENKTYASKITVKSVLDKNNYTHITFNLNGGTSSITTNNYLTGVAYGTLPTPTKEGFGFIGWYSDQALTNKVESTDLVESNITNLYAKWSKAEFVDNSVKSSPVIYAGLIPVTIDDTGETKGTVKVADTSSEWYNYGEHKWANAAVVSNASEYLDENNEVLSNKIGEVIPMTNIVQMYVWIPRFKYQLFNTGNDNKNEQMINVEFEDKDAANYQKQSGTQNEDWLTHPAFTFGNTELSGFWVGKFQTGYKDATTSNLAKQNIVDSSKVVIKPNAYIWRYSTVANMFNTTRGIESDSSFNFNSNQVDTHIMKNMEWGAVAYLTNSAYGRYIDSSTCVTSGCEVWTNPSSNYIAGYSGDSTKDDANTTGVVWNDSTYGGNSSTTGNVYGIYDMSGAAFEFIMANTSMSSPYEYKIGKSSLSEPDSKYYDSYVNDSTSNANKAYNKSKLGDAIRETIKDKSSSTGGWFSDEINFPYSTNYWFIRGGYNGSGSNAGLFCFGVFNGTYSASTSWRIVLTAQ